MEVVKGTGRALALLGGLTMDLLMAKCLVHVWAVPLCLAAKGSTQALVETLFFIGAISPTNPTII
jgi:hypothetical protein